MPKNLTPHDQWETQFEVPLPGEPRNIGPLETLFQRLLNRTERLRSRIGDLLGLPWDSTPPDTLAGLHQRVGTLEAAQGGTTLQAHRSAPVLDHPDGSVTLAKLGAGLGYGANAFVDPNAYYNQTGQNYPMQVGEVASLNAYGALTIPLRIGMSIGVYELVFAASDSTGTQGGAPFLFPNGTSYAGEYVERWTYVDNTTTSPQVVKSTNDAAVSGMRVGGNAPTGTVKIFNLPNYRTALFFVDGSRGEPWQTGFVLMGMSSWRGTAPWNWMGSLSFSSRQFTGFILIRRLA